MRTREKIEEDTLEYDYNDSTELKILLQDRAILETLLDIRDLLTKERK